MTWEDILKQNRKFNFADSLDEQFREEGKRSDTEIFNELLKEFKEIQKRLRDVHDEIDELINNKLVSRYSQVYGGFLPKSLMGKALGIGDE